VNARGVSFCRAVRHVAVVGVIIAGALASSGVAAAQQPPSTDQGPRFNWGPGQPPPQPEGPEGGEVAPAASPGGRAAPAPRPEYAPAPGPARWGGCNYDLRGSWSVEGRQREPQPYRYDATVYVRQFRAWLQIEQPQDGVSYYGVCRGDTVQLDVYYQGRFIGYQDGTIRGGRWGGQWIRFDWTTFTPYYATGQETWRRWSY
jgi:hypothetical protein